MTRLVVSVFIAVTLAAASAKFPNNPKPCEFEDGNCIKELVNFLFREKASGYSSLNLVKIDPLNIAAIDIKQGKESPVNIDLEFRDTELVGLSTAVATEIKGFGKDLTQHHELHLNIENLSLIGDYKISGRVLILPVHGAGKSNITLVNTALGLHFSGVPQVKPDGTYLKIKRMRLTIEPQRVYFHFASLFNNDKVLGDNMNMFINENWQDIFREVQKSIQDAFGQVFESVINNVFQKYPYEKLFA